MSIGGKAKKSSSKNSGVMKVKKTVTVDKIMNSPNPSEMSKTV